MCVKKNKKYYMDQLHGYIFHFLSEPFKLVLGFKNAELSG